MEWWSHLPKLLELNSSSFIKHWYKSCWEDGTVWTTGN